MTGLQIQNQVESWAQETMDSADALVGINEGIKKMPAIMDDEVASTAYTAYTWYSLPTDCIKVVEVNIVDTYNTTYTGWRLNAGRTKILMADSETYIIHFLRKPVKIATIDDTPEMNEAYHDCLVTYLKGWFKSQPTNAIDDDEKREAENMINNIFYMELNEVKKMFSGGNKQMIAQRHA